MRKPFFSADLIYRLTDHVLAVVKSVQRLEAQGAERDQIRWLLASVDGVESIRQKLANPNSKPLESFLLADRELQAIQKKIAEVADQPEQTNAPIYGQDFGPYKALLLEFRDQAKLALEDLEAEHF